MNDATRYFAVSKQPKNLRRFKVFKQAMIAMFLLVGVQAQAKDSQWLVCTGKSSVVNIFESRATNRSAEDRQVQVTVLYGAHEYMVINSPFDSETRKDVIFEFEGDRNEIHTSSFLSGAVSFDLVNKTARIDCNIHWYDDGKPLSTQPFSEDLKCKEM